MYDQLFAAERLTFLLSK